MSNINYNLELSSIQLSISDFISKTISITSSPFIKELLQSSNNNSPYILNSVHIYSLTTNTNKPQKTVFTFDVTFPNKFSNFLNIVHGGSISILSDNLSNMCLYYLTKSKYSTLDITLTYKSKMILNKPYTIQIIIEKQTYKTVFITCNFINDELNENCVNVILIKSLKPLSKM